MKINSLENLVGVKEVHGQKLIQEPIYSSSGMIDWEAMVKAYDDIHIWIDHETNTISFKVEEGACTADDIIAVARLIHGSVLQ